MTFQEACSAVPGLYDHLTNLEYCSGSIRVLQRSIRPGVVKPCLKYQEVAYALEHREDIPLYLASKRIEALDLLLDSLDSQLLSDILRAL
jgi:hypothetical protein